jgi:L-alanine-DL-glutamate epimerase-like enolase superfamily enzyme
MRITGIEARLYRIPPTVQIQDSIQRISHWEFVVTTVTTDAGITGTGFAYTLGIGGTAVRELVGTYLAPLVLGADPVDVERIWTRCWWELHALGSGGMTRFALATIDIALWDILAQKAGVPLSRLLGGFRDRIPAYGSGINAHLDGEPLLEQMRGFLEQGYRAVKMKVGRDDPQEDVARVAAVRRLIGQASMLDANQKWTAVTRSAGGRTLRSGPRSRCADDRAGHRPRRACRSRGQHSSTSSPFIRRGGGRGVGRTFPGWAGSRNGSRSRSWRRASTCRSRPTS